MENMITLDEFREGNYALCVRPKDQELLIGFCEAVHIKHPAEAIREARGTIYVDFYVDEICMMTKDFYESEDYTIIEALDFLAANGFDIVDPVELICNEELDGIL